MGECSVAEALELCEVRLHKPLAELEIRLEEKVQLLNRQRLQLHEARQEIEDLEQDLEKEIKRGDQQSEDLESDLEKAEEHIAKQAAQIDDLLSEKSSWEQQKLEFEQFTRSHQHCNGDELVK